MAAPEHYGGWPVEALLDHSPRSGWACPEGKTAGNVFVFELAGEAVIERFEFDTAGIDEEGAAARDVLVEVSATSRTSGFTPLAHAGLAITPAEFEAAGKKMASSLTKFKVSPADQQEVMALIGSLQADIVEKPAAAGAPKD